MLRGAHDRHRDLRPLVSAQGAAAGIRSTRKALFVTRYELHTRNPTGAEAALRPTALLVPDAVNDDPMAAFDHQRSTANRRAFRQCCNKTTPHTAYRGAKAIPTNGQKSNSP